MSGSTMVMWILIGFYAVVMALAAWERNWWRSLYYFAAILISLAVMGMTIHLLMPHRCIGGRPS